MKKKRDIRKYLLLFGLCFFLVQAVTVVMTGHWFSFTAFAEGEGIYPPQIDKKYEQLAYYFYWDLMYDDMVKNCGDILNGSLFSDYGLENTMESIYNALKTIGIAMMTTYFLMELMDKVTREQFDVETLLRMLIKFIIAKTLIMDNGITILKAFLKIGNGMAVTLGTTGPPEGTVTAFLNHMVDMIEKNNMIMDIIIAILTVIPWLINKLVGLVIRAICYGRLIDIVVRGGFAPIGCCSMVQEGFSGHGIRYLKKYFGSILQGAVIMGILYVCGTISSFIFNTMLSNMTITNGIGAALGMVIETLVVGFTEIMCVVKSNQIANEIAGA